MAICSDLYWAVVLAENLTVAPRRILQWKGANDAQVLIYLSVTFAEWNLLALSR